MLKQLRKGKSQSGFTIIEVLIVLAIAGLIMVIVFLAVPALQRSQRNQARKTDANNSLASYSDFTGNNGGAPPSASCYGSAGCTWLPKLGYFQGANTAAFGTAAGVEYLYNSGTGFTAPSAPTSDELYILSGATCSNGATGAPAQGSARQVAVYYGIEGAVATQCVSQ